MAAAAATTVREFDTNTRYTRDTYMSYSDNEEKVGEIEKDFNIIHADMDRTANQNSQNELEYLREKLREVHEKLHEKDEKLHEKHEKIGELYEKIEKQREHFDNKLKELKQICREKLEKEKKEKKELKLWKRRHRMRQRPDLSSEDSDSMIDNSNPQTEEIFLQGKKNSEISFSSNSKESISNLHQVGPSSINGFGNAEIRTVGDLYKWITTHTKEEFINKFRSGSTKIYAIHKQATRFYKHLEN
jgi:hypothetical protein